MREPVRLRLRSTPSIDASRNGPAGDGVRGRMARRWRLFFAFFLVVSLAGCDQATKRLAETTLRSGSISLVSGVLDLTYTENRDVGFALLRMIPGDDVRRVVIVALVSLALLALLFALVRWGERSLGGAAGLALIAAGGVGNLIDRIARGYVVDFVHVHHWPVFNVADVCVAIGAALVVLSERTRARAPSSGPARSTRGELDRPPP